MDDLFLKLRRLFDGNSADDNTSMGLPIRNVFAEDALAMLGELSSRDNITGYAAEELLGIVTDPLFMNDAGSIPYLEIQDGVSWRALASQYLSMPQGVAEAVLGARISALLELEIDKFKLIKDLVTVEDPENVVNNSEFQRTFPGYGVLVKGTFLPDRIPADTYIPDFDETSEYITSITGNTSSFSLDEGGEVFESPVTSALRSGFLANAEAAIMPDIDEVHGFWRGKVRDGVLEVPINEHQYIPLKIPADASPYQGSVVIARRDKQIFLLHPETGNEITSMPVPEESEVNYTPRALHVRCYDVQAVKNGEALYRVRVEQGSAPELVESLQKAFILINGTTTDTGLAEDVGKIHVNFFNLGKGAPAGSISYDQDTSRKAQIKYPDITINLDMTGISAVKIAAELAYQIGRMHSLLSRTAGILGFSRCFTGRASLTVPPDKDMSMHTAMEGLSGTSETFRFYLRGLARGLIDPADFSKSDSRLNAAAADLGPEGNFYSCLTPNGKALSDHITGYSQIRDLFAGGLNEEDGKKLISREIHLTPVRGQQKIYTLRPDCTERDIAASYHRRACAVSDGRKLKESQAVMGTELAAVKPSATQDRSVALIQQALSLAPDQSGESENLTSHIRRLLDERERISNLLLVIGEDPSPQGEESPRKMNRGEVLQEKLRAAIPRIVNKVFSDIDSSDIDDSLRESRGQYGDGFDFEDRTDEDPVYQGSHKQEYFSDLDPLGRIDEDLSTNQYLEPFDIEILLSQVLDTKRESPTEIFAKKVREITRRHSGLIGFTQDDITDLWNDIAMEILMIESEFRTEEKARKESKQGKYDNDTQRWLGILVGTSSPDLLKRIEEIYRDYALTDSQIHEKISTMILNSTPDTSAGAVKLAERLVEHGSAPDLYGPLELGTVLPEKLVEELGRYVSEKVGVHPLDLEQYFTNIGESIAEESHETADEKGDFKERLVFLEDIAMCLQVPHEIGDQTGLPLLSMAGELKGSIYQYLGATFINDRMTTQPALVQEMLSNAFMRAGVASSVFAMVQSIDSGYGLTGRRQQERSDAEKSSKASNRARIALYKINKELESFGVKPDMVDVYHAQALATPPHMPALPSLSGENPQA